jgi:hypothetical protein
MNGRLMSCPCCRLLTTGRVGETLGGRGQRSLGLATRGNIAGKDESGPARRPGASRQQGGCCDRDSLSGLKRGVTSGLLSGRCGPSSDKTARVQHILDGNMQAKWTPARTLTPERKGSLTGKIGIGCYGIIGMATQEGRHFSGTM